jgi:hypothetical protein
VATTTKTGVLKTRSRRARSSARDSHAVPVKIVRLVPRRLLERVVRARAGESPHGCHKCGSLFVEIEPAFVHCRYCGSLSRIRGASLLAQEEWEMRSGMRLAS